MRFMWDSDCKFTEIKHELMVELRKMYDEDDLNIMRIAKLITIIINNTLLEDYEVKVKADYYHQLYFWIEEPLTSASIAQIQRLTASIYCMDDVNILPFNFFKVQYVNVARYFIDYGIRNTCKKLMNEKYNKMLNDNENLTDEDYDEFSKLCLDIVPDLTYGEETQTLIDFNGLQRQAVKELENKRRWS